MLDADDGGQAFSDIVAGQTIVFQQLFLFGIPVDAAGQRCPKTGHVGSTVLVSNDVGVALDAFTERIGPLQSQFHGNWTLLNLFLPGNQDRIGMKRLASHVYLFDKFRNSASVVVFNRVDFLASVVRYDDLQPSIEEGCFLESAIDLVKVEFNNVCENGRIGFEGNDGACVIAGPDRFQF